MNEIAHVILAWAALSCTPVAACDAASDLTVAAPEQQARDPWLGADKFTHAGVTWAAASFIFATARSAGVDGDDAVHVAVPAAFGIGIAKEIMDSRRTSFSYRDLVADAAGAAAAYFFLREVR